MYSLKYFHVVPNCMSVTRWTSDTYFFHQSVINCLTEMSPDPLIDGKIFSSILKTNSLDTSRKCHKDLLPFYAYSSLFHFLHIIGLSNHISVFQFYFVLRKKTQQCYQFFHKTIIKKFLTRTSSERTIKGSGSSR